MWGFVTFGLVVTKEKLVQANKHGRTRDEERMINDLCLNASAASKVLGLTFIYISLILGTELRSE